MTKKGQTENKQKTQSRSCMILPCLVNETVNYRCSRNCHRTIANADTRSSNQGVPAPFCSKMHLDSPVAFWHRVICKLSHRPIPARGPCVGKRRKKRFAAVTFQSKRARWRERLAFGTRRFIVVVVFQHHLVLILFL